MSPVTELRPKPWSWTVGDTAGCYVLHLHDTVAGGVMLVEDIPLRTMRMDAIVEALNSVHNHPTLR